ncbi:MAG: anaerobic ribonucleoside-triphosphate reductase [archaeon]
MTKCNANCETYSRIVGYFRPVQNWNIGKREEFKDRLEYTEKKSMNTQFKSAEKPKC